jgi:hypothetical protein
MPSTNAENPQRAQQHGLGHRRAGTSSRGRLKSARFESAFEFVRLPAEGGGVVPVARAQSIGIEGTQREDIPEARARVRAALPAVTAQDVEDRLTGWPFLRRPLARAFGGQTPRSVYITALIDTDAMWLTHGRLR